jgi:hypothetical protein
VQTNKVQKRTVIGNVVNLDIRTADESSVAAIERIDNVVNLLYAPQTAHLLMKLAIGNVVNPIEAAPDARVHYSRVVLNHDTFHDLAEPMSIVVLGMVVIDSDVTRDDIEHGLSELAVAGQLVCPEHVAGAVEAKARHVHGSMHIYPQHAKLIVGSLTLDEQFLRSLDDGAELTVLGKLNASKVLPNELLERRIRTIHVADGVVCREENAEALLPRLERKSGADRVTVIPAGFHLVDRALVLSASLLTALPTRKLYCTEQVRIDEDVDADALDRALDALIVKHTVICPQALAEVVSRKLDVLQTETIFYRGKLWLIDSSSSLSPARFDYLEGEATLIVTGKLGIDPDVAPKTLVDRLDKVHNLGLIEGTADQIAALQSRLGIGEGSLKETGEPKLKPEGQQPTIHNMVNLKL